MYRKILERSRSFLAPTANSNLSRAALDSERKFTRMLILVLGVFTLCWVPFIIILLLRLHGKVSQLLYLVAYCFAYLNSGMNFIIYAIANDKYRAAFKKILCFGIQKVRKKGELSGKSEETKKETLSDYDHQIDTNV